MFCVEFLDQMARNFSRAHIPSKGCCRNGVIPLKCTDANPGKKSHDFKSSLTGNSCSEIFSESILQRFALCDLNHLFVSLDVKVFEVGETVSAFIHNLLRTEFSIFHDFHIAILFELLRFHHENDV